MGSLDDSGYTYLQVNAFTIWGEGRERYYISYGARTVAANLPAGTATYAGGMYADMYSRGNPSNAARSRLEGDLNLTADFDESTLEGTILNIRLREPGEDDYSPLPDTTRFEIGGGRIADGQFTATLTGVDSNNGAPITDSVRGYEGGVLGEFYGPAAEEVGGVLNATRDEDRRVMGGVFHGRKQQ